MVMKIFPLLVQRANYSYFKEKREFGIIFPLTVSVASNLGRSMRNLISPLKRLQSDGSFEFGIIN